MADTVHRAAVDRHPPFERDADFAVALGIWADDLPPMPTHDEWTAANATVDAEYLSDISPEERAQLDARTF